MAQKKRLDFPCKESLALSKRPADTLTLRQTERERNSRAQVKRRKRHYHSSKTNPPTLCTVRRQNHMGRVGEYEMGKTIATGAFSKVKLVTHEATGKSFVAKILPKSNRDVENDIRVEISILRKVCHANVVQLIEILESPRNYYIILEPVLGGDLCAMIMEAQDGIPEPTTALLFAQLVQGVHACHRNGVAHRDLKPENILLTPDRQVKISDFGLSRLHKTSNFQAHDTEFAQTLTGTLAYVSPEVLSGQYDAFKADLWSLGCILYVMLTGRFPFGSAQGRALERRILSGDIAALPPSVSAPARDLTMRLMSMNPKERPSLDEVLRHPFFTSSSSSLTGSFVERMVVQTTEEGSLVTGSADVFEQVNPEDDGSGSPASPGNIRRRRVVPE